MQVGQGQLAGHLADESGLFADGIDTTHIPLRFGDRQHRAGQAATAADIEDARRRLFLLAGCATGLFRRRARGSSAKRPAQRCDHSQAIRHVLHAHLRRIAQRCQVVRGIPLAQQRQVAHEQCERAFGQVQAEGRSVLPQRHKLSAGRNVRPGHAASSPAGRCSLAAKPLKRPFFKCTSSSEIAAGVTPAMREAWPSVCGRWRLSFCRTSWLSAGTWA